MVGVGDEKLKALSEVAERICLDFKSYKDAIRDYENPKKHERMPQEKIEKAEEYKSFIEGVINLIKIEGFKDEVMNLFLEPAGIAEAIASTITFKITQLRKLFHQIKTISKELRGEDTIDKYEARIIKILPILAYSKGRELISEDFYQLMKAMVDKVRETRKVKDYEKLVEIVEAIVAYHKYHYPKES